MAIGRATRLHASFGRAGICARGRRVPNRGLQVKSFPQGGYWVMVYAGNTLDEVRVVADAGPGYLSLAAHGHADALALVLSLGGRPVLIDPGTYAYHTQRRWRDYFAGPLLTTRCVWMALTSRRLAATSCGCARPMRGACHSVTTPTKPTGWLSMTATCGCATLCCTAAHQFQPSVGRIRVSDERETRASTAWRGIGTSTRGAESSWRRACCLSLRATGF